MEPDDPNALHPVHLERAAVLPVMLRHTDRLKQMLT